MTDNLYAKSSHDRRRAAIAGAGTLAPDLSVNGVSYTLAQVDDAERRIKTECPKALVTRGNYGWTLVAARGDKSESFFVFDTGRGKLHPTVIGNIDAIILALKE